MLTNENSKKSQLDKFAPVAPIHIYEAMADTGYIPQNILLLAHDVVKDENINRYSKLFNGRWDETTVIMDNSLIELGGAVDLDMVRKAVATVYADVVVVPDALSDGMESAELTIKSWNAFYKAFEDENTQLLAVVQGETQRGFFGALEFLAQEINPDWISIPRRTESKFGYHRTELIPFVDMFFPDKHLHLLGFSDYPWEDIRAAQNSRVSSIDSAAPLRSKMPFSDPGNPRVQRYQVDMGNGNFDVVEEDWWDHVQYEDFMLRNIQQLNKLIG